MSQILNPSSGGGGGSGITGISGDVGGTATGPVVNFTGDDSGAVFTRSSNDIELSFDSINLPNSDATDGVVRMGGQPMLGRYIGSLSLPSLFAGCSPSGGALTGRRNVIVSNGEQGAGGSLTSGRQNTGIGFNALANLVDGNFNLAVGDQAGVNLFSNESSNICVGNSGQIGESNTLRIGSQGTGDGQQSACYIAGISSTPLDSSASLVGISLGQLGYLTGGAPVTINVDDGSITGNPLYLLGSIAIPGTGVLVNVGDPDKAVVSVARGSAAAAPDVSQAGLLCADSASFAVDGEGFLTLLPSSLRYKENIKDDIDSSKIYNLNPVSFDYKKSTERRHIGLIAEDVAEHVPEIVLSREGQIEGVKYDELTVLLLNEIKKLNARIEDLEGR